MSQDSVEHMRLSVFCVDIGSIPKGNFGWYGVTPEPRSGQDPEGLVREISSELSLGHHVSLGFECPLFVPLPQDPIGLTSKRKGEGRGASRPPVHAAPSTRAWKRSRRSALGDLTIALSFMPACSGVLPPLRVLQEPQQATRLLQVL